MRYALLVVVVVASVVALGSTALASQFAVGGQVGYAFGESGLLLYGVTGEASLAGPLSLRGTLLFGSLRDPASGFSMGVRWASAAALYRVAATEAAKPYLGAGFGELSASVSGLSVGFTLLDLVGGARFAVTEGSDLFVEGHYMLPVGLPSGMQATGSFALTGGVLYSF